MLRINVPGNTSFGYKKNTASMVVSKNQPSISKRKQWFNIVTTCIVVNWRHCNLKGLSHQFKKARSDVVQQA
jgi:hypothetical protein